ncbi:hypothetical protein N9A28_04050 [Sulfurimonas sp.]|nr:hypothetical protein [Sulfurimonas sp.]
MKIIRNILILCSSVLLTACHPVAKSLDLNKDKKYSTLYEVNYDFDCGVGSYESMTFKKGSIFLPVELGGQKTSVSNLPKGTIGFKIFEKLGTPWYILIFPDGNTIAKQPIAVHNQYFTFIPYHPKCSIRNTPPFKLIQNN